MIRGAASWMDHAACANRGNRRFYSDDEAVQLAAISVCAECPVQQDCLNYALNGEEPYGVWGGLTPKQRRQLLAGRPVMRRCAECSGIYDTPRGGNARSLYCTPACKEKAHRRADAARHYLEHRSCIVCGASTSGSATCSSYCRFVHRRLTSRTALKRNDDQ